VSAVLFFIAATGAIAGAIGVVVLRDPFFAVLSLVGHLLMLAMLFLLLRSEFVAAAQVVVYAGAVMVLYVFVVAYVGDQAPLERHLRGGGPIGSLYRGQAALRGPAVMFGAALLIELMIALLGTGLKAVDSHGAGYVPGFGSPRFIGNLLLTRFLLVFEVASFLLLIAAVGAVVLARRRRGGIDELDEPLAPLVVPLPEGTGTMAEAGAGLTLPGPGETRADAPAAAEPEQVGHGGGW
jgi:NADH:ubiquinone oxidoreductase subunit 6 (subunit J)